MNTVEFKDIKFHIQHKTLFNSRSGGKFRIVEYKKSDKVTVEFEDTGYTKIVQMSSIRLGNIKDRLRPSYSGVGILGDKYGCQVDGKICKEHLIWNLMIFRCYSIKNRLKNVNYNDCFVSENFKYYPYFYEWCNKQVGFNSEDFELDKDLLIKGNREYGEDTCVFIPREINVMLTKSDKTRGDLPIGVHFDKRRGKYIAQMNRGTGVRKFLGSFESSEEAFNCYKVNKESYIKELAEKWKDAIDPRAYDALMNYEVEIDD